jgi:hypothetical protein
MFGRLSVYIFQKWILVKTRGYNQDRMIHQINKNHRKFVPCANSEMYLQMFEEIYNYEYQKKNRLTFTEKK